MRKLMLAALMAVLLCGCDSVTNGLLREDETANEVVSQRFIGDYPNEIFGTVVDTETGITYLTWNTNNGQLSVGGITPLLDINGMPVKSDEVVKEEE